MCPRVGNSACLQSWCSRSSVAVLTRATAHSIAALPLHLLPCLQVFDNVVVQPRDAREASDVFYRQRIGDVLLTYENEVVLTNQVGQVMASKYIKYAGSRLMNQALTWRLETILGRTGAKHSQAAAGSVQYGVAFKLSAIHVSACATPRLPFLLETHCLLVLHRAAARCAA